LDTLINKDGLRIGSKVLICRKGDVIPQVVSVIPDKEKKPYIQIPAECPECGETLNRFSVNLVCDNIACSAKTKGIFTNMFSTLDIKGLSDKFVEKATEVYDITTIDELMNLTVDEIEKLPGFAKKSAQKAYDTIHSVTDVTPEQFFALLNIPNQGVRVFENLFSQFPMEKLLDNSFKPEDILDTKGIAEKSANAIHTGIQSNLDRLRENAKWFTIIKKDVVTSPENHKAAMMGKSFCITGTLNLGTRKDYETLILSSGGKISAVTKNLDFLVTNDADTSSSKMKKALEINSTLHNNGVDKKIVIIDENQLRNILEI
jgi:DNA ligase (NAD+)